MEFHRVLLSSFGVCPNPLATSLMHNHWPSVPSRHRLTLLSPPETARMFPVKDQLTLHTTSSKVFKIIGVQDTLSSLVQITTLLSWEQLAIIDFWRPREGAQATSRTQSICISSLFSSTHVSPCSLQIWKCLVLFKSNWEGQKTLTKVEGSSCCYSTRSLVMLHTQMDMHQLISVTRNINLY